MVKKEKVHHQMGELCGVQRSAVVKKEKVHHRIGELCGVQRSVVVNFTTGKAGKPHKDKF